jgi:triacylglycerol lipase
VKLFATLLGCCSMLSAANAAAADTVVLLHAMGRSQLSMTRLAWELRRDGYDVINATYPSRTQPLETLATEWLPAQLAKAQPNSRVHFVTHSMGGILLRLWRRECAAGNVPSVPLGRVVMLAPPNAGSEIPDRFATFAPFHWWVGVNGGRLGTAADALPHQLGPWLQDQAGSAELGIIAGDRSGISPVAQCLPQPNDGKVSVASTRLAGGREHVVLPSGHTWMGWRRDTISHVKSFLRTGAFARS